ncbi:hypothetical protein PIB30_066890, partial [Stylosanthes scabra]|nr:hypothetical protein [Stylosanthes scabra]
SYEFEKEDVICQWMAQGFLKTNESGKSIEDIGEANFGYLIKRSFLQPVFDYDDTLFFMMHNLVHDLAIYVFGESGKDLAAESSLKHGRSLRTIMPRYLPFEWESKFDSNELEPVIMKLSKHVFRVLSLSYSKITELPASIGRLTHLFYLNISYTELKELPDSICDLLNLQILILRDCLSLERLPDRLCNLVNLRKLDSRGSHLQRMPPDMHNLTSLRTLTEFIVSKTGARLADLAGMSNLKVLAITNMQNVADAKDASDAKLKEKKGLFTLELSWNYYLDDSNSWNGNEMEVLENLEPHKDLKILRVECFPSAGFPEWVGDPSYSSLRKLHLDYSENCESLPTLGLLPNLRELSIEGFKKVSSIGLEFYGEMTASQKPFQSLEVLNFFYMPEWKEWNIVEGMEFLNLVKLSILYCPKLVGDLPKKLPSLEKLEIVKCSSLVAPLPNVSDTCQVFVSYSYVKFSQKVREIKPEPNSSFQGTSTVSKIEEVPHESLMETKSVVSGFPLGHSPEETSAAVMHSHQVEAVTDSNSPMAKPDIPITTQAAAFNVETLFNEEAVDQQSSFQVLKVSSVSQLKSLPPMLHTLKIEGCESLEAIPNDLLTGLTALKELYLISCGFLRSLPSLGSVTTLYIHNCRRLESLSSSESKKQLHHLSIGSSCDSTTTLPLNLFHQLKSLCIWKCPNLLAFHFNEENICNLRFLESLEIRDCPRLKSFPEKGLHAPNLVSILLSECKSLENLPNSMASLKSLKSLFLHSCPEIESFPPGGLPSGLVFLSIVSCYKLRPQKDWGLHNLKSLSRFELKDGYIGKESFPEENLLPSSINFMSISMLKDLKKLDDKGFQQLNSLRALEIHCCEMLESLPDEGFPSSLEHLCVQGCSLLT